MVTTKKKKSSTTKKITKAKIVASSSKNTKPNKKSNSTKKTTSRTLKPAPPNNNTWKILSFIFAIAIILIVGGIITILNSSNNHMIDEENSNMMNSSNENTNSNVSNLEITLTIVEDPKCINCQVDAFAQQIKENLISNLKYEKIEVSSSKGQQLKIALNLDLVPAYLFSKEIAQRDDWTTNLAGAFLEKIIGGETYYMLNPQYVQGKYLIGELPITNNTIVIGNPDAKLTLYEFSDFECPFCAIAEGNPELLSQFIAQSPDYVAPLPKLFEEYIDTGKVRFVFYNFPLENIHKKSRSAHNAALCANEQNKWKEYNDILFLKRNDWVETDDSSIVFKNFANQLGLDKTKFDNCVSNKKYDSQIDSEIQLGLSKGVGGTPGFFVGKHFLSGAQDYKMFKSLIDVLLSN